MQSGGALLPHSHPHLNSVLFTGTQTISISRIIFIWFIYSLCAFFCIDTLTFVIVMNQISPIRGHVHIIIYIQLKGMTICIILLWSCCSVSSLTVRQTSQPQFSILAGRFFCMWHIFCYHMINEISTKTIVQCCNSKKQHAYTSFLIKIPEVLTSHRRTGVTCFTVSGWQLKLQLPFQILLIDGNTLNETYFE